MSSRSMVIILLSALIVIAAVLLVVVLTNKNSEKSLSGYYSAGLGINKLTYDFKKNGNVVLHLQSMGSEYMTVDGKYDISEDGNLITFNLSSDDNSVSLYGGTFPLVRGDDYILIGAAKYNKVENFE